MTSAQAKLCRSWALAALAVVLLLVFGDVIEANASWLRWLVFVGVCVASFASGTSRTQLRGIGRERMLEIFQGSIWLKVWFSVCALVFVGAAVYAVRASVDFQKIGILRFLILSFVAMLGPFLVVSERERFKELGKGEDAI